MPICCVAATVGLLLLITTGLPASGLDNELSRATLKGLPGVSVKVEAFDADKMRAGFDSQMLREDVEARLGVAGIKVLGEGEAAATPGGPWLYVNVNPLHQNIDDVAAYSVRIELHQDAVLPRDPPQPCDAATWSTGSIGVGGIPHVRRTVETLADRFVRAWRSVNPRE
jgi:hypothetical protein